MIKRGVDYKLNVKPMYFGFYHDYVFEGPCRMGTGFMLTKEYDCAVIAETVKSSDENIRKWLGDRFNILPSFCWDRNEEFLCDEILLEEALSDAQDVDVYLVPAMSRLTDLILVIAQRTRKPIMLIPPVYRPLTTDCTAGLMSRGLEVYAERSWEATVKRLNVLRVKKALNNTRILCAGRYATTKTPSAGDTILNPEDVTERLGVRFAYINPHELLDQTHVLEDNTQNPTIPGRHGLNLTGEDVKEINQMLDEVIEGASVCEMDRDEMFHSFRAHYTIKKMLDHYDCNAFSAPCPDICATRRFNEEHFTFCANHSLLNEQGIPSACEYDLCAVISLAILEAFSYAGCYMGNTVHTPFGMSYEENGRMVEPAHYNMDGTCDTSYYDAIRGDAENVVFTWHSVPNRKFHGFNSEPTEYAIQPFAISGWGVTFRHNFNQDKGQLVTMCRIDPSCKKLFVARGEILAGRGYDDKGCTLGVYIKVADGDDFFHKQLAFGNHVPIAYGDYFDEICELGKTLGLEVVTA